MSYTPMHEDIHRLGKGVRAASEVICVLLPYRLDSHFNFDRLAKVKLRDGNMMVYDKPTWGSHCEISPGEN